MAGVLVAIQGYLAQRKTPHTRTLNKTYAYDPTFVLGEGMLLMSEVLLQRSLASRAAAERLWQI